MNCICGHPKIDHNRRNGECGFVDPDTQKECHCLYFEPANWLEIQDAEEEGKEDDDA